MEQLLGGDLGELAGPFAPCELLQRPRLGEYAAYLAKQGVSVVAAPSDEPRNETCTARSEAAEDDAQDAQEMVHADAERPHGDAVALLHRAAAAGAIPLIEFLIGLGYASVDGHCPMRRLKAATRAQRSLRHISKEMVRPLSPLHSAAAGSSPEAVRALLRLRASVTATEAHGAMALHLAADRGPAEVVELLLGAGAPLAAKDLNLQTALHFAARSGNVETLAVLLQSWCADQELVSQSTRVYGGPLDWRDRWHRTPVHWAVLNDHTDALQALLQARASAEPPRVPVSKHAKNTTLRHEVPLEIAQRRGHTAAEQLLLSAMGQGRLRAGEVARAAEPAERTGVA